METALNGQNIIIVMAINMRALPLLRYTELVQKQLTCLQESCLFALHKCFHLNDDVDRI